MANNLYELYDQLNYRIYDLWETGCDHCAKCKMLLAGRCEINFLRSIRDNLEEITKGIELLTRGKK